MKKLLLTIMVLTLAFTMTGCMDSASDVASYNLSEAADNFEIIRRIYFYDSIQGEVMMEMEGRCSIEVDGADNQLEVTCKIADDKYQKHFLGLSNNVTYWVEQVGTTDVDTYHYKMRIRPEVVIPDIEIEVDTDGDGN